MIIKSSRLLLMESCKESMAVIDSFSKAWQVINGSIMTKDGPKSFDNIMVSISGGSDSDVMLDLIHRTDIFHSAKYMWFDTGLEYQATKDHLAFLEHRYDIEVIRMKPIKPIPVSLREFGVPFLNKFVSEMLSRLQRKGFQYEDLSLGELAKKYEKCLSALKWWVGEYDNPGYDSFSRYSIRRNKWLKEFLMEHPPDFPISTKCCEYAKKGVARKAAKDLGVDLEIIGVRKYEGGIRGESYESCFGKMEKEGIYMYRPLFWYTGHDKEVYCKCAGIEHSRCYTEWNFTRTGCCCCPFGRDFEDELKAVKIYEPNMYKAAVSLFGKSYEYTREYREFAKFMNKKKREEA